MPVSGSAFDPVASGYDRQFSDTAVGRFQRAVVHRCLEPRIQPGEMVLELNCGTGEDAQWLAKKGCRVLATDISAEMVAITAAKAQRAGLHDRIQTKVLDIRAIADQGPDLPVAQLVLSNFGGLNCLSPGELQRFGAALSGFMKPGTVFIAVVMGRFCWWESAYYVLKGRFREAFRRLNGGPLSVRLDEQSSIPTWYYTPAEFCRFFPELRVSTIQPVGFWLPPSYLDPFFQKWPQVLDGLFFLEKKCRGRLWAAAADHFLVVFRQ